MLHTDVGPQWENADALWNAMAELGLPTDIKGEGIVIGTIDTGISPGNSSFAATGDDGYSPTNPLGTGNFLGACDEANTEQFDPLFVVQRQAHRRLQLHRRPREGSLTAPSTTTGTARIRRRPRAATS